MLVEQQNTIDDVALIFEGGGMRNSYSSGVVTVMLEHALYFNNVYGLSAGATNAVDYLSRDMWRSKVSLTEYTDDLDFRALFASLLHEEEKTNFQKQRARSGKMIPLDYATFSENPAQLTLSAVDRDTGKTFYFTKRDFSSEQELLACVRASTSYPIIMSPTHIKGRTYYDGGVGEGGGIMLPRARADGFSRFFVIRTRPKGFRKPEHPNRIYDIYFWHRPAMRKTLNSWSKRYNIQLDELEQLEEEGSAYVFYTNDQSVSNMERTTEKLRANYEKGYSQALSELDSWYHFLGLSSKSMTT